MHLTIPGAVFDTVRGDFTQSCQEIAFVTVPAVCLQELSHKLFKRQDCIFLKRPRASFFVVEENICREYILEYERIE